MSTPKSEFTMNTSFGVIGVMDIQDIRIAKLQLLVDRDSLSQIAKKLGKPDRQIKDMLAKRKPFGEKVAREMEKNGDLGDKWFDGGSEGGLLDILGLDAKSLNFDQIRRIKEFSKAPEEKQIQALDSIKKSGEDGIEAGVKE